MYTQPNCIHFDSLKKIRKKLLTSLLDPKLGANGNVTKDGTKNTGNHFAKTSLPGDNKSYTPSPNSALIEYNPNKAINKAPHPPNDDGKDVISNALNSLRKKRSNKINEVVDAVEVIKEGFLDDEESVFDDDILSDVDETETTGTDDDEYA